MKDKSSYILEFGEINKTMVKTVGGKGANLGELWKIKEIQVPEGFCVSTEAFKRVIGENKLVHELLDQLSLLTIEDRNALNKLSSMIRKIIEEISIPEDIQSTMVQSIAGLGADHAYAIRSSATAEDLFTASFAGQQDTYLNIIGKEAILKHISKCWASLFTERAVVYRVRNGIDHRNVYLSVVVQKMVFPQAAGVLFTADPVTSNRKILSVDACYSLGEALVSGLISPDNYKLRDGEIVEKKIATKKLAVYTLPGGGTKEQAIEPALQNRQVLTNEQIIELERIGRKIEAYFGCPQDIEWCLRDHVFYIVQSRPVTTLYPIPVANDQENHVYISVGHQQMMTDALRPLGLSIWQMTVARPMHEAGGRLFVDIAADLASPARRPVLINLMDKSDPHQRRGDHYPRTR